MKKKETWNFALLRSLPSRVFFLVLFHKEGGRRGARCVHFFSASTHIEIATWVMGCSTPPQAWEWKGFFQKILEALCSWHSNLFSWTEWTKADWPPSKPQDIPHCEGLSFSFHKYQQSVLFSRHYKLCTETEQTSWESFQFNSNRPLVKALYRIIVRQPLKTKSRLT